MEAADSLLQFFTHWNTQTEMQSDRGSQFVNRMIEELCRRKDIAQVLSLPRSHQDNGRGERMNKEVLQHLKGMRYHQKIREGWHSMLPFVKFVMNNSVHSVTGYLFTIYASIWSYYDGE
jgi:transposase InsO family protein